MIAEFVAIAGVPTPDTPWPLVVEIARRAEQFEARRHLTAFDAVRSAIGASFGNSDAAVDRLRDKLQSVAYPTGDGWDGQFPQGMFDGGDDG